MFRLASLLLIPALILTARAEDPQAFSAEALARQVKPAVVSILPDGREGTPMGIGTGFLISADGLVATNMHVIGEGRRLRVELADGSPSEVREVVAWNRDADLAVLRIAAEDGKEFPALPLAAEVPAQGTPVLVMGNPRGLRHSVVEGVISATREIEGREMLQLAIPIEQGNSGGPVLDRNGRVLGVVTLKSAITDNLGFAVPVAALQKLKDSPSPVAMKNWLTIGALNPKRWQPGGCDWTQRAGTIRARGTGSGFGGRALCIYQPEPPEMPYELSVEVKLDDESGAAGLVFCSDGGDVHYGFYPTAGGQRLTRFEGPDVYSWTILEQLRSPAYRNGDWNHLRVRVEAERIQCWLNGELVATHADTALRSGRAGLCTFRGTEADFRNFRLGKDLSAATAAPGIREAVRQIGQGEPVKPETLQLLAGDAETARAAAEAEAVLLEKRAAALRQTARQAHEAGTLAKLKTLLSRDSDSSIPLAECALLMARLENPDIDPAVTLDELDRMAAELSAALTDEDRVSPRRTLERLNRWMFAENGFHGSEEEMTNPANSRLNEVIDDREGIPLTLAIVHLELARRIGLKVEGVPFPGYFMTRLAGDQKPAGEGGTGAEEIYIDVFDRGRLLSRDDARQRVYDMFGAAPPEEPHQPATHRAMILRMAANLTAWAVEREEPERVLRWLNVTLELDPDDSSSRLQRVLMHARQGRKTEARADIAELLRQAPEGMDLDKLRDLQAELGGE